MSNYSSTCNHTTDLEKYKQPNTLGPLGWLRAGWQDMRAAPMLSVSVGTAFTLLCLGAYAAVSAAPMFSAAILVLLLLASPYLAAIAYTVSMQRERGHQPRLTTGIDTLKRRLIAIGLFALISSLIVAAWVRLTSIAFAFYYNGLPSKLEVARIWAGGEQTLSLLLFLGAASVVLALSLFIVGAISLPMITERNANVVTAVRTSARVVRANKLTVAAWLITLVTLVGIALLSRLVLMPLIFPLLAYATWHSYRQLVHA